MLKIIPIAQVLPFMSEGVWAATNASNVVTYNRTAGATAATLMRLDLTEAIANVDTQLMGAGLYQIETYFSVGIADQDTVTVVTLFEQTYNASGVPVAVAVDATTYSVAYYLNGSATASAAAVAGIAQGQWKAVVTFDPVYQWDSVTNLTLVVDNDPAATTALKYSNVFLIA